MKNVTNCLELHVDKPMEQLNTLHVQPRAIVLFFISQFTPAIIMNTAKTAFMTVIMRLWASNET